MINYLQEISDSGRMEPRQADAIQEALKNLEHVARTKSIPEVLRVVDKICKIFTRDQGE
jgi:hypothetical protein